MSEPYAFINPQKRSLSCYRDQMPSGSNARSKFDRMNAHLGRGVIQPGQLIIVGDDSTAMCTPGESLLMSYAQDVRQALIANDYASSQALVENYDLLQSIMSYGSIGIGSVTSAWNTHLKGVENTLVDINAAHQRWRSGTWTKDQFLAQRQKLFNTLDGQLRGIGRWGTGLKNNSTIKKMLGISSKRYLLSGEIPSYAKTVKRINNAARALSAGLPLGVVLDLAAGAFEIREACSTGRERECTKATFVETGKMMIGIPAAIKGGDLGARAALTLCLRMAAPSRGASLIACGIAGGAIGGWGSGKLGSWGAENFNTMLYELIDDE